VCLFSDISAANLVDRQIYTTLTLCLLPTTPATGCNFRGKESRTLLLSLEWPVTCLLTNRKIGNCGNFHAMLTSLLWTFLSCTHHNQARLRRAAQEEYDHNEWLMVKLTNFFREGCLCSLSVCALCCGI